MRAFWDRRARENPMWVIHSNLDYNSPDVAEFWRSGEAALDATLAPFGLSLQPADRVLEIGCGIGRITRALAGRAGEVVGLDVSAEMLELGRKAMEDVGNVELELGSGRDLGQFADAGFDVAYSFVVFQHIPDPAVTCAYITEIGRVLRPGGWALFQVSEAPEVHLRDTYPSVRGVRRRLAELAGRAPRGTMQPQWLGSAVDRDSLLLALHAGHLELERTTGDGGQFCMVLARSTRPRA